MGLSTYTFELPTKIEFGEGVINKVGDAAREMGAKRALIVADKGVIAAGLVEPVKKSLETANVDYVLFDRLVANPRIANVEDGYEFAKQENIDFLIGVGGGSSMDTAKAIGVLLTHGGRVQDYCGYQLLKRDITPMIAIPTTAGTGSEVTPFAVVTDTDTHVKLNIFDPRAAAKLALIDPAVLLGVPPKVMASCGVDALTHAIESYTCKLAIPHTDAYALAAIEYISKNIRGAVHNPDIENCTGMMLGSTLAGIAFGYSDVGGVHCMGEAIGGRYDTPHGVSCAVFLPDVCRYNIPADVKKYANIAKYFGVNTFGMTDEDAAEAGVRAIEQLCADIDIPKFRDLDKVDPKDFEELSVAASKNVSNPSNPREMTPDDYLKLFKEIYNK